METMIDILRERLPDGLEITKVKDTASASQIKIWFTYKGMEAVNWISKTCAPGCATRLCDKTIASTMLAIALDLKDLEMADYWNDKMLIPAKPYNAREGTM